MLDAPRHGRGGPERATRGAGGGVFFRSPGWTVVRCRRVDLPLALWTLGWSSSRGRLRKGRAEVERGLGYRRDGDALADGAAGWLLGWGCSGAGRNARVARRPLAVRRSLAAVAGVSRRRPAGAARRTRAQVGGGYLGPPRRREAPPEGLRSCFSPRRSSPDSRERWRRLGGPRSCPGLAGVALVTTPLLPSLKTASFRPSGAWARVSGLAALAGGEPPRPWGTVAGSLAAMAFGRLGPDAAPFTRHSPQAGTRIPQAFDAGGRAFGARLQRPEPFGACRVRRRGGGLARRAGALYRGSPCRPRGARPALAMARRRRSSSRTRRARRRPAPLRSAPARCAIAESRCRRGGGRSVRVAARRCRGAGKATGRAARRLARRELQGVSREGVDGVALCRSGARSSRLDRGTVCRGGERVARPPSADGRPIARRRTSSPRVASRAAVLTRGWDLRSPEYEGTRTRMQEQRTPLGGGELRCRSEGGGRCASWGAPDAPTPASMPGAGRALRLARSVEPELRREVTTASGVDITPGAGCRPDRFYARHDAPRAATSTRREPSTRLASARMWVKRRSTRRDARRDGAPRGKHDVRSSASGRRSDLDLS